MKKAFTLLALFGLAMTASAASMTWTVSSIAFNGTTLKSDNNLTAYLVYLGNGGSLAASYDPKTISTDLTIVDTVVGSTSKGAATSSYDFPVPSSGDYTELNGDVFALLLSYADSASGKTFYNLSSATYTVSGMDDMGSTALAGYKPAASTFSYGTTKETGSVSAGGGWVAVPEPSTAALALAGLALLLKRRKA